MGRVSLKFSKKKSSRRHHQYTNHLHYLGNISFDSETKEYLPRTKYDIHIDETSNKPGQQLFEKMIAGLYLGEVFRLVLCDMIEEGVLFHGQNTYKLDKPFCFDTALVSLIEA